MCILRLSVLCTFMISLPLDPKKPNLFVLASTISSTATSDTTSTASTITADPFMTSASSDSTSAASTTSADPSTSSTTGDSTSTASTTSDSTSTSSTTSDSTFAASATGDSTSTASTTSDSTFTASTTSDSASAASTTSDSTSTSSTTSDSTSTSSTTSDSTSTSSTTSDSTSAASTTSDSTSTSSTTSDSTFAASTTSDSTSAASTTSDSTSAASTTSDSTSTAYTSSDGTSTASTTSDTTPTYNSIDTTSLSDMNFTSSNTGDDTSTVSNTSDDTSVGQNTSNNLSSDSITSKATSTVLTSTTTATLLTSTATPTTTTAYTLTKTPVANLPFRMKFNNSLYNDSLKDNNSPYYKQVSDNYTTQLTNAWRNGTPGFEDVVIKSFRLGSLIVDYIVIIKVNKDNMTELLDNLNFTVLPHLEALEDADEDYLKSRFESDIEDAKFQVVDAQKDLCNLNNCPEGWQCQEILNSLVLCTSPCANKSCNNGICSWDIDKKAICSCKKDDHYIYGGDDCSEKAEKLTMESETIIAIAAGVGGGLILILLVVLIVTCCRRKSPKDKMGESSQMSMLPMTEIGDDNAALITRDMSLTTDLATSRLYRDTKTAPSNLRDVVPVAELGSFEEDGRSRSGREMRYGDDGRLYHSIPENQIYGAASAGRGYTNKALEGDNDQAVAYFYQPEKLNRFGMESSDVNRKRQDETARYSSAPTRDDRSQYISDSAPKREIEPDYFDWSNGAPRSSQEPRFTHTNLDKANAGDPRGHYKSGVDPRTHQQPSSRPYSPDSSAPSYYNDPPQRSNVYDYILAEKPVAIRRPTLMPQKR